MEQRRPYTFDRVMRILFTLCIIAAVVFALDALSGVLLPFLVACLIAYMLEPIVKWNKRWMHLKRRFLPVTFTLLEVLTVFGIFCWIFFPYLANE